MFYKTVKFKVQIISVAIILSSLSFLTEKVYSQNPDANAENPLDLPPEIINNSPVLQKWMQQVPDVLEDINNDPSFRTRIGIGYAEFPSTQHDGGINVSVHDIFIGRTGLTISGDYETSFGKRDAGGVNLQYYLLPLGYYVNVAPVVGYRSISTNNYSEDGVNIGGKVIFPLSRSGAADLSFSQTFISPGEDDEVGVTNVSFGYAITKTIRIATEIEKQNSRVKKDSQFSVILEWMP
ncbi:MAG: hypothetical protein AB4062_16205 [Crocosphaera sp.]